MKECSYLNKFLPLLSRTVELRKSATCQATVLVAHVFLFAAFSAGCEKRAQPNNSPTITTIPISTANKQILTGRVFNIAQNRGVEGATVVGSAYADSDRSVTDSTGMYILHLKESPISISVSIVPTKPGEVYFFTRGSYRYYPWGLDTGYNFDCYPTVAYSAFFAKQRSGMRLFSKSKVSDIAGSQDTVAPYTFSVPVVVGITNTISYTGIPGMLNEKQIVPAGPIQDTVHY